jgi:hypothetical protein
MSLKQALERLGFGPCHHMIELIENPEQVESWMRAATEGTANWDEMFRGYRSTVDWPGAGYWRELSGHFPEAKVVLTMRDPQRWYVSTAESIYRAAHLPQSSPEMVRLQQLVRRLIWEGEFGGRFDDVDHAIGVFNERNEAVRREIPADRLLEFEIRDGWEPLCAFLGMPVPDEPFPHANDRQAFAERLEEPKGQR